MSAHVLVATVSPSVTTYELPDSPNTRCVQSAASTAPCCCCAQSAARAASKWLPRSIFLRSRPKHRNGTERTKNRRLNS